MNSLKEACQELLEEVGFGTSRKISGDFEKFVSIGNNFVSDDGVKETLEKIYQIVYRGEVEVPKTITHDEELHLRIPDSWNLQDGDFYYKVTGEKAETTRTGGTGEQAKVASDAVAFFRPISEFQELISENRKIVANWQDGELPVKSEYFQYIENDHFNSHKNTPTRLVECTLLEDDLEEIAFRQNRNKDLIRLAVFETSSDETVEDIRRERKEKELERKAKKLIEKASEYIKVGDIQSVSVTEDAVEVTSVKDNQDIEIEIPI